MAGWLAAARLPFFLAGKIAYKALDGVNAYGGVEFRSVAFALARVITGPTVHGWKGIILENLTPRLPPSAGPRMLEPGLNILSSRTSRVAGREVGDPVRQLLSCRSRARGCRMNAGGVGLLQHQCVPPGPWASCACRFPVK